MLDGSGERVDLAHASPFSLGTVRVQPSHRLIGNGAESVVVEPRVMQLLVALARAGGAILSRDDLIEQCWHGRIVGDNAIQRAISHARKVADTIGGGSFDIETVRGVGYRLRNGQPVPLEAPAAEAAPLRARFTRRSALAAGGASALAAGGTFALFVAPDGDPSSLARKLYLQGEAVRREQDGDVSIEQAIAFYSEAVRDSPRFAAAWAGLALAYCDLLDIAPLENLDRVARLAVAAADRALSLEPDSVNGRLARLLVPPAFRRWSESRRQVEELSRADRRNWSIHAHLGRLAAETGQHDRAIEAFTRALELEPLLLRVYAQLVGETWAAGRLHETDRLLEEGMKRWPRSWIIWNSRFQFLALQGNAVAAVHHVSNPSSVPWNLAPPGVPKRLQLVRALETRDPAEIEKAKTAHLADAIRFVWSVPRVSLILAALGADEELFDLLRGYYLGVGRFATPMGPWARRHTYFLFQPPLRPFRGDPRFTSLLKAIDLA